jgi:hypothetical protein
VLGRPQEGGLAGEEVENADRNGESGNRERESERREGDGRDGPHQRWQIHVISRNDDGQNSNFTIQ